MQMRLQPQEAACSGQGGKQEELSSSGGDLAGDTNGDNPQANAETNCPAADADKGERAAETSRTSTSPTPAETIGKVGCSSQHCSQPEPSDTSSALPGERGRKEPGLEAHPPRTRHPNIPQSGNRTNSIAPWKHPLLLHNCSYFVLRKASHALLLPVMFQSDVQLTMFDAN
ncbi:hypothetical protein AV530_007137 [Patagioenas fasciata monilis]|uniref:Uncharacterized protein n=1 Tax=Patagioenas fasciata monilis TaxID=372326 RepID=A0A1V4KZP2_PATFA|nr:hypothetical protein AV530_007137 [Patagioenas fasciata monilis]